MALGAFAALGSNDSASSASGRFGGHSIPSKIITIPTLPNCSSVKSPFGTSACGHKKENPPLEAAGLVPSRAVFAPRRGSGGIEADQLDGSA